MFNRNSGYIGSSMSVRAHDCYNDGIMPKSKWTKRDFIDNIDAIDFINDQDKNTLKTLSLTEMKRALLRYDSWHHTSSKFNKTDFYKFDLDYIEDHKNDIINLVVSIKETTKRIKEERKQEKQKINIEIAYIKFFELSKNGRYYNRTDYKGVYAIKGDWFYSIGSQFQKLWKKKLYGNCIEKRRYFKNVAEFRKYLKVRNYSESDIMELTNEFKRLSRNIKKLNNNL